MNRSGRIHFDREQVDYLIKKTGEDDAHKAVEVFAKLIKELGIDPFKMQIYLKRLMEMDGLGDANRK